MTPDEFFVGKPLPQTLFALVQHAVDVIGPARMAITKSQIAFWRRHAFAWLWMPDRYLRGHPAPLVLSVALPQHDQSSRWKEVVEPAPGRFMHHLELHDPTDIDSDVRSWLQLAWDAAE